MLKLGVIPSESPTVPIAEAVSNMAERTGTFSTLLIIIPLVRNNVMYISEIVAALRTVSVPILLPKKWVSSFFLKTENAEENSTAIVVVFMPPAVDPGEPPINIRIMVNTRPASLKAARFTVLKPAVLGVMD